MVPKANINSKKLIFFKALGSTLKVPKTPEASLPAKVLLSFNISACVIFSALLIVSLKSSRTKIPSPASSFKILSKITSSACGLIAQQILRLL